MLIWRNFFRFGANLFADLPIKLNVTMENNVLIIIQGEKNCKKIFSALEGA